MSGTFLATNLRLVANEAHIEASRNGEPGNPNLLAIQEGITHQILTVLKPTLNAWKYQ